MLESTQQLGLHVAHRLDDAVFASRISRTMRRTSPIVAGFLSTSGMSTPPCILKRLINRLLLSTQAVCDQHCHFESLLVVEARVDVGFIRSGEVGFLNAGGAPDAFCYIFSG